MNGFSDEEIIHALVDPEQSNEKVVAYFVKKARKSVAYDVTNKQGTNNDAKEVLAQSLLILLENLKEGKFRGDSSLMTYLTRICHFVWLTMKRQGYRFDGPGDIPDTPFKQQNPFISLDLRGLVNNLLEMIPKGCKEVLSLWARGFKHKEIARKLRWSGAQISRNKTSECLKKLKSLLEKNPQLHHELKEYFK